jgi:hypothetical protein
MRKLTERWLVEHPHWQTNAFASGKKAAGVSGQPFRDMKEYVHSQLFKENGELKYPIETAVFLTRLRDTTMTAQLPFRIVRPAKRRLSGSKRAKGELSSKSWQEIQKNSNHMNHIKVASTKFKQSDHGRIGAQTYNEKYRAAHCEIKKKNDQATTFNAILNSIVCKHPSFWVRSFILHTLRARVYFCLQMGRNV